MSDRILDQNLEFMPLEQLRPHEEILPERLEEVVKQIKQDGLVDYPILVDEEFGVILDGHHRYHALVELKVTRAPVVRIPYNREDVIRLKTRPNAPTRNLSKQEVLRMGLSEDVFPPKSTRHVLSESLQPVDVPLTRLRKDGESMA